ncbi:chromatin assembly factor 1 subunit B-like [Diadema antillarum]|uniref:chromatin assembly factor 1 subunit B-like n=1 Tax=Diadema antillarum TaxID=105358 RepID=UPI003A854754
MKVETPEISWHGRDPVYSIDFQPGSHSLRRIATASTDTNVQVWYVEVDNDGKAQPTFAASLSRHTKAVNVVRFSPDGELIASGADDSLMILWKLQDVGIVAPSFGKEDEDCKETWSAIKTFRGHLEDIYDISWSSDGSRIITGSVDNSAIIWDVQKGEKLVLLKDHRSFVQGVAWDPKDKFCATISCDRSLRVYSLQSNRCMHHINKMSMAATSNNGESMMKQYRMFHDDTMKSFFRRLTFSPDGELLMVPAGCLEMGESILNTTYVFSSSSFSKPVLHLPGPNKATIAVKCCPVLFELQTAPKADGEAAKKVEMTPVDNKDGAENSQKDAESPMDTGTTAPAAAPSSSSSSSHGSKADEGQEKSDPSKEVNEQLAKQTPKPEVKPEEAPKLFDLPYRIVFAVATEDSILLYDTQQNIPIGLISNIHYHQLSDVSWSPDGRILATSSTDGYCSFITFEPGELGKPYTAPAPAADKLNDVKPAQASPVTSAASMPEPTNQGTSTLKTANEKVQEPVTVVSSVPRSSSEGSGEVKRITPIRVQPSGSVNQPRRIQLTTLSSPTITPSPATSSSTPPSQSSVPTSKSPLVASSAPAPSKPIKDDKQEEGHDSASTSETRKDVRQCPQLSTQSKVKGDDEVIDLTEEDEEEEEEEEEEEDDDDCIDMIEVEEDSAPPAKPVPVKAHPLPPKPSAPASRRITTIKLL